MYSLVFSTPVFLPGKSHGQKSQLVSLHGIVKSQTQLRNSPPHHTRSPHHHRSGKELDILFSVMS